MNYKHLLLIPLIACTIPQTRAMDLEDLSRTIRVNHVGMYIASGAAVISAASALWAHYKVKKLKGLGDHEKSDSQTKKNIRWWQDVKKMSWTSALMCTWIATTLYANKRVLQQRYDYLRTWHERHARERQEAEFARLVPVQPEAISLAEQDLLRAVSGQNVDATREALERGADVNIQANGGWTPLHAAVYAGNIDMVNMLLAHQADPNRANNENKSAYELAREQNGEHSEMAHAIDQVRQTRSRCAKVNPT